MIMSSLQVRNKSKGAARVNKEPTKIAGINWFVMLVTLVGSLMGAYENDFSCQA